LCAPCDRSGHSACPEVAPGLTPDSQHKNMLKRPGRRGSPLVRAVFLGGGKTFSHGLGQNPKTSLRANLVRMTSKADMRNDDCPSGPVSVQSFQKFLNRPGAISVYRTVCMMFLWPCSVGAFGRHASRWRTCNRWSAGACEANREGELRGQRPQASRSSASVRYSLGRSSESRALRAPSPLTWAETQRAGFDAPARRPSYVLLSCLAQPKGR